MKKKVFTTKDLKISIIIAIVFTMLYFIDLGVIAFQESMGWSDLVNILSQLGFFALKVLTIIGWYMCIERYYAIEYQTPEENSNKRRRLSLIISMAILVIFGYNVFRHAVNLVGFIGIWLPYIDRLQDCINMKIVMLILWVIHFVYCVLKRRSIGGQQGRVKYTVLFVILVMGLLLYFINRKLIMHACEQTESIRYEILREEFEKMNGNGSAVKEPYN